MGKIISFVKQDKWLNLFVISLGLILVFQLLYSHKSLVSKPNGDLVFRRVSNHPVVEHSVFSPMTEVNTTAPEISHEKYVKAQPAKFPSKAIVTQPQATLPVKKAENISITQTVNTLNSVISNTTSRLPVLNKIGL